MNELNINEQEINGHKYVGKQYNTLIVSQDISSTNPINATITDDCILVIVSAKTGTGYSAMIRINGIEVIPIFFFDGINILPQTCVVQLPVKKGDKINITTDLSSTSQQTWRMSLREMFYR